MFMDDTNQPVSLKRLFTIVKENTKQSALVISEEMMLPFEIREASQKVILKCPIKNISDRFLETVSNFILSIANEVSQVRKNIGVKDDKEDAMT